MYQTKFGSLQHFEKGGIELINGRASDYVFSNLFEVAASARPYDKVVVGKNLQYVIESLRAEGDSPWFAAAHDEFVVAMDGEIDVHFIKLTQPERVVPTHSEGSLRLEAAPDGRKMGFIRLQRGHQALLPKGAAYQFRAQQLGVLLLQTVLGPHSIQKWSEICYR
jgi:hypothetical protein